MNKIVNTIEPSVLKWAREQAGYSIDDIASKINKDVEILKAWESGQLAPTYSQLEILAYSLYKRPLAVFFLPHPPKEPDLKKVFRTLPDFEYNKFEADTRYALRCAEARQINLKELNNDINKSDRKIFKDINLSKQVNSLKVANEIREYLGISIDEQLKWESANQALNEWRNKIEAVGVYVFKRSFKQKDISGFSLLDNEFPIIYLNSGNSETRQTFSLLHELSHILYGISGVILSDDRYISRLPPNELGIEQTCNYYANEILVPSNDFDRRIKSFAHIDDKAIADIANKYNVSREVILRKLLDRRIVTKEQYDGKVDGWIAEYLEARKKRKKKKGGPSYYKTQIAYLGNKYLNLIFSEMSRGHIAINQAADYLGVKVNSIAKLEDSFLKKVSS